MKKIILLLLVVSALVGTVQAQSAETKWTHKEFFDPQHNSYLGWSMLGFGYPWSIHTGIVGRHGGLLGFGYWASAGIDIVDINDETAYLNYSAGLKIFPYKSMFIAGGYGTLGAEKMSQFNGSDGRFNTAGWRQRQGPMLMGGYDILGDLRSGGSHSMLSISAGAGYDMHMKNWKPLVRLTWGSAWGLGK